MAVEITRTPSSNGNQKKWTWSAWIKKATVGMGSGDYQMLFTAYVGNSSRYTDIYFREDYFEVFGGVYSTSATTVDINVSTNRKLRDPSGFYHLVVAVDTTQATAANRVKIYVNGVQETSLKNYQGSSAVYPAQNNNTFMNVTTAQNRIGASGGSYPFKGLMSHVHFCDGYAYAASDFGESDSVSGIWKPKTAPSVTHGTNGFFLKFENSGNLDLDSSTNNHTFATSGTLIQTVDTPSNNFATLNPLDVPYPAQLTTYSNANLVGQSTETGFSSGASTFGVSSGKWYAEFKIAGGTTNFHVIGVITSPVDDLGTSAFHDSSKFYGVRGTGLKVEASTETVSWATTWTTNDIIGLALDCDNNRLYVSKNGQWANGSGDYNQAFTASPAYLTLASDQIYHFTGGSISTGSGVYLTMQANFGSGYFGTTQVSSAQADDGGLGIMEYDVPANYRVLCTENIKDYG
tara:strand:- start:299 stop:1681 length:1383 start_codon:yes stop_codon:yes gene_type:complete